MQGALDLGQLSHILVHPNLDRDQAIKRDWLAAFLQPHGDKLERQVGAAYRRAAASAPAFDRDAGERF